MASLGSVPLSDAAHLQLLLRVLSHGAAVLFPVLLRPAGVRGRAQAPEHGLHRHLLSGVHPQDHGLWVSGEIEERRNTSMLIPRMQLK